MQSVDRRGGTIFYREEVELLVRKPNQIILQTQVSNPEMQLYNNNNIVKHGNFLKNKNKSKKQKSTGDLRLEENPKKKCYFKKKKLEHSNPS